VGLKSAFYPPGTYALSVTGVGFSRQEQSGLELLVNTPATANVRLKIGQVNESVNLSSEIEALNTVDASIRSSFDEKRLFHFGQQSRGEL
jgi:hypothetical protein